MTSYRECWKNRLYALSKALCVVAALTFASCDNVSCPLNTTVESVYGFYASSRSDNGAFVPGGQVSVADTITITALGADVIIANRLYDKSSVKLPVSYYGEVDSLEFKYTDAQKAVAYDTLWIVKQNQPHLDNPSCPLHIWHTILSAHSTHHLIDTLLISNPDINYDGLENIQIYFRTETE